MIAVDSSVAVPAFVAWHEAHLSARQAVANAAIPAHARLETYSVLTRLAPPHRLSPDVVVELLGSWFPKGDTLVPSVQLSRTLVERCFDVGVDGGAVYDGLIGLTVLEAGGSLLTRDERAASTYRTLGIDFQLLQ